MHRLKTLCVMSCVSWGGFMGSLGFTSGGLMAQESAGQQTQFKIPATDEGLPGVGPIRRYEWFQNLWQTKRSGWAKQVEQDQAAVVFLGDSITQGWGPNMRGVFGDLKVANRGISGDTTRGMLVRLQEDVLALNPAAVVMLMGTNDLEENATPEQVAANFAEIVAALRHHDDAMPIVVCLVFPSAAEKSRPSEKIVAVNKLFQAAVKGKAGVTVVDTWTLFANENGDAKVEEFPDLLHPNGAGYAKWANALRPILATLDLIEREEDQFEVEEGYRLLFNGENLSGWCFLPTPKPRLAQIERMKTRANAPAWPIVKERQDFDEEVQTPDGRYVALHDRLIVTTPTEGRRIQQLWTQEEFAEDFVLKLEFRATPNADSGIFVRGKQLQCRDYPLAGPYKELREYREGAWNEIVIEVQGKSARCTCNGEVLEENFAVPESGPIGLEGDRGQIEYRRIRVRPAP